MKFLISLAAIAALSIPVTAEAHARQKSCDCHCNDTRVTAPAVKPITTVTWTWVRARRVSGEYVPGHWSHPQHGREFTDSRPVHRPHANAVWASGHWEGKGRRRHWVSGAWKPAPGHRSASQQHHR